ncbi:MAG: group II truncated hemoglobin [Burkholderiaceae bacterium]
MKQTTLFDEVGGESTLRRLVDAYLVALESRPEVGTLRALYPQSLSHYAERMTEYLIGWLGGPPVYLQKHGMPMLRERHVNLPIGSGERDMWMACMREAIERTVTEPALRERLDAAFWRLADSMRNRDDSPPGAAPH